MSDRSGAANAETANANSTGAGGDAKPADKAKDAAVDLNLLEEDDEFEEFPAEEWNDNDKDATDVNIWEENWDDDNIEDDFSMQLMAELKKLGTAQSS